MALRSLCSIKSTGIVLSFTGGLTKYCTQQLTSLNHLRSPNMHTRLGTKTQQVQDMLKRHLAKHDRSTNQLGSFAHQKEGRLTWLAYEHSQQFLYSLLMSITFRVSSFAPSWLFALRFLIFQWFPHSLHPWLSCSDYVERWQNMQNTILSRVWRGTPTRSVHFQTTVSFLGKCTHLWLISCPW